jgi:hypothetical protein
MGEFGDRYFGTDDYQSSTPFFGDAKDRVRWDDIFLFYGFRVMLIMDQTFITSLVRGSVLGANRLPLKTMQVVVRIADSKSCLRH